MKKVCGAINAVACAIFEGQNLYLDAFYEVGISVLVANAAVAFALNVAVVFLVRSSCSSWVSG